MAGHTRWQPVSVGKPYLNSHHRASGGYSKAFGFHPRGRHERGAVARSGVGGSRCVVGTWRLVVTAAGGPGHAARAICGMAHVHRIG